MAFHDWNRNGKSDRQDDYIEYMAYKDFESKKQSNSSVPSGNNDSCLVNIITILVSLPVLYIIGCIANWLGCQGK